MKNTNRISLVLGLSALVALLSPAPTHAQALVTEHFDYPTGDTLGSNGWNLIAGSGGTATPVVAQNLSYSGFAESSGNAVQLRPNGQDWYRTYTTQAYTTNSTASLYYSFLMRVDNLGTLDATGGYFAGLGNATGGSLAATVAVRLSGEGFQLGIGKRDSTSMGNYSFSDTVYDVGQTILVVGSYNLVAGPINNDFASLWLDPGNLGDPTAPAPTLNTALSGLNDDVISFSSFTLKPQGNASSTQIPGSLIFDELRIGNSWADVALVPEPSLTHLLVLGAFGSGVFLWIRRRRAGA
jgi:hypothetical protein